ncbi:MAG: hypothetical protein IKK38_09325 [Spirochaetaceae bacterium]|nr:hypothetical protein [Spirochaetaceae bacterium]
MTREEFESKRAENLERLQRIEEREQNYKQKKENANGFDKICHFLNVFTGALGKSLENYMKNME